MTPEIIETAQALLDEARTSKEVAEELGLKANTLRKAIQAGKLHKNKDLKKS
jgi:transcription initiation factor IIE alpha subunit